jgi:hypothetical protein
VARMASGEPPISFVAHQLRAGNQAGARAEFEDMLAQLVAATSPGTRMIAANPGDWGIDVLVGDLAGQVTIWQAKYFMPIVTGRHRKQIEKSFHSARSAAARHGFRIDRWVLCVPSSMDAPTAAWWDEWKAARQVESAARVELWDETALRTMLIDPRAAHVRRHYYDPYSGDRDTLDADADVTPLRQPDTEAGGAQLVVPEAPPGSPWRGGDTRRFGADRYLIHDEPSGWRSPDHAWMWQEGTADQIEPRPGRVWLRQVRVLRDLPAADGWRAALRAQARLLASLEGIADVPRLLDVHEEADTTTVVTAQPAGPAWRERYGPRGAPLDRIVAATALAAAVPLCTTLAELHRRGHSHRALTPDTILVVDRSRRAVLRDIGLAALPPAAGEGPAAYRAPEQAHPLGRGAVPGARTDVYQIAGILYHTMTGHPPTGASSAPVRATNPDVPQRLDELLRMALDADPRRRPRDIGRFVAALRDGRRAMSRGGGR